jgi:hypothetical protein
MGRLELKILCRIKVEIVVGEACVHGWRFDIEKDGGCGYPSSRGAENGTFQLVGR